MKKNIKLSLLALLCLAATNAHAMNLWRRTTNKSNASPQNTALHKIACTVILPYQKKFDITLTLPNTFTWRLWQKEVIKQLSHQHSVIIIEKPNARWHIYKYARAINDITKNAVNSFLLGTLAITGNEVISNNDRLGAKTLKKGQWRSIKKDGHGQYVQAKGTLASIEDLATSIEAGKEHWALNPGRLKGANYQTYTIYYILKLDAEHYTKSFVENLNPSTNPEKQYEKIDTIFTFPYE